MEKFEDLEFTPYVLTRHEGFENHTHANLDFENGYGVSVIFGKKFNSNGVDTYEVAKCYKGNIIGTPKGYMTKEQVTQIMISLQNKKPR